MVILPRMIKIIHALKRLLYSRVPNKRKGAFNRTEEKKQPELISVQCTINVLRGLNCQN